MIDASEVAWNWFTYGPDSASLAESVERVIDLGGRWLFVWQESACPITSETAERLERYAVERGAHLRVRSTRYNRRGNLNGAENMRGQLACFRLSIFESRLRFLAKIDSDTLILDPTDTLQDLHRGAGLVGTACGSRPLLGAFYALPAATVSTITFILPALRKRDLHLMGNFWMAEDLTTLTCARAAGVACVIRRVLPRDFLFDYTGALGSANCIPKLAPWASFGPNISAFREPSTAKMIRETQAQRMADVRAARFVSNAEPLLT